MGAPALVADRVIVFEDHAGAKEDAVIDATKARQAASHPDWIRAHVPGTETATIVPVLVTSATKACKGAMPSLGRVSYWPLEDFRQWAEAAPSGDSRPAQDLHGAGRSGLASRCR